MQDRNTIIRKYAKEDRQRVRDIAFETALMGEPASLFYEDRDMLADILTLYFTDYEPESSFVADSGGRVVGYLTGAKDEKAFNRIFLSRIIPKTLVKAVTNGVLRKNAHIMFLFRLLGSFIKGEFIVPDFSKAYPAILHINLEKGFRGMGLGSKLIAAYSDYLAREKVKGMHLFTMSDMASHFFSNAGFVLLHKGVRSYLKDIVNKDVYLYVYGKKLI